MICIILVSFLVCQIGRAQITYNIYPIAGQVFAVDPAIFFGDYGKMNYYSISNSSVPFKLTNSGTVINNNVSINGTIISTTKTTSFSNYRYGYLVEVYGGINSNQFMGYQLYEGILQSDGQIQPKMKTSLFNPPNTTCFTTEYISLPKYQNIIAAVCITHSISENISSFGLFYNLPQATYPIYMPSNVTSDLINQTMVQSIQTQVTVSQYGQTYLSIFVNQTDSFNFIKVFSIENPQNNYQSPYLGFLININAFSSVSFYIATDLTLFILFSNSISIYNATNFIQLGKMALLNSETTQVYTNFSVYQTTANAIDQIFYIAVVSSQQIIFLQYENGSFNNLQEIKNPATNQIQSIFITPYLFVFTTFNEGFAIPWQSTNICIWNDTLHMNIAQNFAAYYNNVLVWALNNGTILTVSFNNQQLITYQPLNASNGSFDLIANREQGQQQTININYYVVSNSPEINEGQSPSSIHFNEQKYTISTQTSVSGKLLYLNDSSYTDYYYFFNYQFYPYPHFQGPIDYVTAHYNNTFKQINGSISVYSNMVQGYLLVPFQTLLAVFYSIQGNIIAQNLKGSFLMNADNIDNLQITNLFSFPTETQSCPLVGQYDTFLYLSVCTLNNYQNVVYIYSIKSSQTIYLKHVNGLIQKAFYLNGILTLCSSSSAFVCVLNIQTTQQVLCQEVLRFDKKVSNMQSIETIKIYYTNQTQNLTQSFGLLIPQNTYVQFVTIGVYDQTNLTNSSNLIVNFTSKNATQTLFNQLQSIYLFYTQSSPKVNYYQIIQTSSPTQVGSLIQVPVFSASSQGNFGINLNFNISNFQAPTLSNVVLQCGFVSYNGTYYGASAVNDLIVTGYFNGLDITYISYRSSKSLFGGDGSSVCIPEGGNIQQVHYLGASTFHMAYFEKYLQALPSSYPQMYVLPNGQVFITVSGYYSLGVQLSQHYGISGMLPLSEFNETFPIFISALNQFSTANNSFNFLVLQGPVNNTGEQQTFLFIILLSCFAGVILSVFFGWLIYCKRKFQL